MLSRDTRNKQNAVKSILELVEQIGSGTTALQIASNVYNSESKYYRGDVVEPMLKALVLTGQLTECTTKVDTFYYIAK